MSVLEIGALFGRYRIVRFLGSGISGECYQAEDAILMRTVTLKLIQPGITLPASAMRQFAREMEMIASFDHPYLAHVHQFGEISGKLYLARDYVSGGSLLGDAGRLWYKAPFEIRDAFHYGQHLAEALDSIHRQGYVHGSLTFANILVRRSSATEQPSASAPFLLADIGLSNFVRRFGGPPVKPFPITTAPEQMGMRATAASDQYALAVIIYCWLAARPPFVGTPNEIEYFKLTETIPPLSTYHPQVTAELDTILSRALAVYPEERFPSILDFTAALEATLLEPRRNFPAQPQETPDQAPAIMPAIPRDVFQPLPQPSIDPLPQPVPSPGPEPQPEAAPEPKPQPAPEPVAAPPKQSTSTPQHALLAARACFLIASPNSAEPYQIKLKAADMTIGRAGSSDIFLDFDTHVSRHHALLKYIEDDYIIHDRKSVSGVLVNGTKISQEHGHILRHGDQIQIGNYQLIFCTQPANELATLFAFAAHSKV